MAPPRSTAAEVGRLDHASLIGATGRCARIQFDVYGLRVSVEGNWEEAVEALRLDFAWFERAPDAATPSVRIVIERRPPDFDAFGELPATFITPRNAVYQQNGRTIIDYFGRVVSIFDRAAGTLLIQSEEKHLAHEAAFHFLLSRAGEHLESRGLVRLHGVALSGASGAAVIVLPSGGGKSTLALRALRQDGVKLLSDDSPLLDRRGWIHPFPLRIGVNPTDAASLPAGSVRRIERMEFHPKLALELAAFVDQIDSTPQPLRHLVLGRRTLGRDARLEPVPRRLAVMPLVREAVIGLGVYQGMEFVLQRGMRDLVGKLRPAATRSACCAAGVARAQVWRLTIGRDPEHNWQALEPLLAIRP